MSTLRVTRRGWIVLALTILAFVVAVNWAMAGKNLACDWRGQIEPCSIVEGVK